MDDILCYIILFFTRIQYTDTNEIDVDDLLMDDIAGIQKYN